MSATKFLKSIGERVRSIRKAKNISQEKLAELSGVHPTYISDIERGKVNASVYSYHMIANALDVPLSELVNIPIGKIEKKIEGDISVMIGQLRTLDKNKQAVFLSAAKGLISGLKDII